MSLTGNGFIVALVILTLGCAVLASLLWLRVQRLGVFCWPTRVSMIVACQLAGCLLAAAVLNDVGQFYPSWSSLFGHEGRVGVQSLKKNAEAGSIAGQLQHHPANSSAIVKVQIPTAGADSSQTALVYLPAAYFDSANAERQFPVVELLDGAPGSPQFWTTRLNMQHVADVEIASGRAVPFIAVMPVQNYLGPGHDGECVNAVHGAQVETTLANNVRTIMLGNFRTLSSRRAWALMGYSTGGYCALNMSLHHPNWYATVVDEAGNVAPYQDITTGSLFDGDVAAANYNDPRWLLQHHPQPDLSILAIVGDRDEQGLRETKELLPLVKAPMTIDDLFMPRGGHTFHTFSIFEPIAFDWLSAHIESSVAPSSTIDGISPVPYTTDQALPPPPVRRKDLTVKPHLHSGRAGRAPIRGHRVVRREVPPRSG